MATNPATPNPAASTQNTTDPTIQNVYPMEDLYFLHGSEQPGSLLVCEKLTITNYNYWSRAMLNALAAKKNLGFINGVVPGPA
ncbi:unnamed protein product [Linum trigynum]|uniref:Retrotransposon Copia-like N-terminal domain-containing protein n=1 Tax=Linum trigynum TaxID=586398 RepID=A0AAV2CEQ8_9ROSI